MTEGEDPRDDGAADPEATEPPLESALERADEDPESLTAADALTVLREGTTTEILDFRDAFVGRAAEDPDLVRELTAGMGEAFAADDRERRNTAAQFVESLAREQPAAAAPATDGLLSLLDDEYSLARQSATAALKWIGGAEPGRLRPAVEHVPALLDSELPRARQNAVVIAWQLSGEDPAALTPIAGDLLAALDERIEEHEPAETVPGGSREVMEAVRDQQRRMQADVRQSRQRVAFVLATVAEADPAALADRADAVVTRLDAETDPFVQGSLVEALGHVAQRDPDAVVEAGAVPAAGGLLDHEEGEAAAKATWTLAMLAESHPEAVREATLPRVEAVRRLLDHEEPWPRGTAASLLGYLAETDPEAVEPARERLLELLDDEAAYVRGSAAMTLGDLGGAGVRAELEAVAAEDADEQVRNAARAALEALSAGEPDRGA